jgi:hypothetical protein
MKIDEKKLQLALGVVESLRVSSLVENWMRRILGVVVLNEFQNIA